MPVLIKYNQILDSKKHSSHLTQTSRQLGWQTQWGRSEWIPVSFKFWISRFRAVNSISVLPLYYHGWGLSDSECQLSSSRAPAELLISLFWGPCNPAADQGWSLREMPSLCPRQHMRFLFSVNNSTAIPTQCAMTWTANVRGGRENLF